MWRRLLILVLLSALAARGLVWWRDRAPAPPAKLDIYLTCDTSGRLEPCGCFMGQYGGLTRVSTALQKAPHDAIKVEIGDAIAGAEDYQIIQYRYLLRAYAAMGYQAVNLGRREASMSASALRKLVKESPVPLLSANVEEAATHAPIASPWRIVQVGGARVALIGVVDSAPVPSGSDPQIHIADMMETLRRILPEVRRNSDIIVCLAFTNQAGLERIAREFYEIHVILGGDVPQPSQALEKINQSYLLSVTNQARALGEFHALAIPASRSLKEAKGEVHLMEDTIAQDPALITLSRDFRKEVRQTPLTVDRPIADSPDRIPGVASNNAFFGSGGCAACHPKASAAWATSGHAHAFDALRAKDSDADPSCIGCHTVGFGEESGYQRSMEGRQLVHVGCESCHGPAAEHVKQRTASAVTGKPVLYKMPPVGAGQCLRCHQGEFSRPFQWEVFWPLIQHGKD